MIKRHLHKSIPGALAAGALIGLVAAGGGCSAVSSAENAAEGATGTCDAFNSGTSAVQNLSIDGDSKAFVTASVNLADVTKTAEGDVYTACKGICGDLQISDTWTAKEKGADIDDAVTEACTQAANHISTTLKANASANCALTYSQGHCEVDAEAQASCEASCTGMTTCMPGDITTLCKPGSIVGQCGGMCQANAVCEGTVMAQAQCTGKCEGNCTGMCDSKPCQGVACSGTCEGTCDADCTVSASAGVSCGASVNCKGGCSVAYTAPKCETTVTPPMCKVSENCQTSCQSEVEAKAVCTPPAVHLNCDASASADVKTVVTTVEKNLPAIILMVQTQGQIVADAANQVVSSGNALINDVGSLSGQALACAKTAATADATASASIKVSVNASANVSGSCGGPGASM
jgi:hypothetical protein